MHYFKYLKEIFNSNYKAWEGDQLRQKSLRKKITDLVYKQYFSTTQIIIL